MNISAKSFIFGSLGAAVFGAILSVSAWAAQSPQDQQLQNAPPNQLQQQSPQQQQNQYPPNQNPQGQGQDQYQNQNPPNEHALPPRPGAINYVEGQANMDGQPLNPQSVGSIDLDKGQVVNTQAGKVEILLTPGVFLRLGDNSSAKMVSPDLANTEIALDRGVAMVEVTDISKNNNIRVDLNDASVKLLQKGLYEFDAQKNEVRVFKGKADVFAQNQRVSVGDHHLVALTADTKLKSRDFDTKMYADTDIYRWSGLRSGYLAEAGADQARMYVNGGAGWAGTNWYWDPWFGSYTFIPGNGIFYSPFGWGFYSPFAVWGSPFFYGGYGGYYGFRGGYYGGGHYYHHFTEMHGPYGHGFEPQGGFRGGFRGGMAGGGFHGGGFGGGMHAGGGHR